MKHTPLGIELLAAAAGGDAWAQLAEAEQEEGKQGVLGRVQEGQGQEQGSWEEEVCELSQPNVQQQQQEEEEGLEQPGQEEGKQGLQGRGDVRTLAAAAVAVDAHAAYLAARSAALLVAAGMLFARMLASGTIKNVPPAAAVCHRKGKSKYGRLLLLL